MKMGGAMTSERRVSIPPMASGPVQRPALVTLDGLHKAMEHKNNRIHKETNNNP